VSSEQQSPDEEELRRAWEEQLRRLTPADVIVQTVVSLINLAGRRLGLAGPDGGERDLEQARDGIDGARALLPVLERREGPETVRPLREALSTLQLEFAKLAPRSGGDDEPPQGAPPPPQTPESESESGPGPAQRSGRLWVPGS